MSLLVSDSPPHNAVLHADPEALLQALATTSARTIAVDAWGDAFEPIDLVWSRSHDDMPSVIRCIEILVEAGATSNTRVGALREVLYRSAPAAVVDTLLRMTDCDPNQSMTEGSRFTPLMSAVSHHRDPIGVARALLRAGADPNMTSSHAQVAHFITPTLPLHEAIARGRQDVVHLLLEHGADPFLADARTEMRPVHWARHVATQLGPSDWKDLEALFDALEAGRAFHARVWPDLKRELMEALWHPLRLAKRGYFEEDLAHSNFLYAE
jgi:Ankyrin repeats (3 copies)